MPMLYPPQVTQEQMDAILDGLRDHRTQREFLISTQESSVYGTRRLVDVYGSEDRMPDPFIIAMRAVFGHDTPYIQALVGYHIREHWRDPAKE